MVDLTELYSTEFNHSSSDSMQGPLGLGELPPPASCFICGSGTVEAGYLNLGVWVDYVGNLLICIPDLIKAAEKVGCLAPSINKMLNENLESLAKDNEVLREQNEKINERLTLFDNALRSIAAGDVSSSDSSSYLAYEKPETVDIVPEGAITDSDGQSAEHVESVTEPGPRDFTQPSTSDDEQTSGDGLLTL